ncbi:MAG TPA: phage holin family protein [Polyangia bacterium]|jgi:hypothetical protein
MARVQTSHIASSALERPVGAIPTTQLLGEVVRETTNLVRAEVELAKAEVEQNVHDEVAAAKGLGVAGVALLLTVNMLLVAIALLIGMALPPPIGALIVAGFTLIVASVAGVLGWGRRVKRPVERTRRTVDQNLTWAKERFAS